jgi:MFS family permease
VSGLLFPIVRSTVLLSAAQAFHSAMLQLAVAVASISLVRVVDVAGLLGLGPAIVLAAGALAAIPAGRSMDRFGRVPVLAAGRSVGVVACGVAALGSAVGSPLAVLAGLAGVGAANGANLLVRTAGGDMYPPEPRARGIGLVLFGAAFGAILGPVVFSPLLAGAMATCSPRCGSPPAASSSWALPWSRQCDPTRRRSRHIWGTARRRRRRTRLLSACSGAGGELSRRSSRPKQASARWWR